MNACDHACARQRELGLWRSRACWHVLTVMFMDATVLMLEFRVVAAFFRRLQRLQSLDVRCPPGHRRTRRGRR